jgi:hypothetical protein
MPGTHTRRAATEPREPVFHIAHGGASHPLAVLVEKPEPEPVHKTKEEVS